MGLDNMGSTKHVNDTQLVGGHIVVKPFSVLGRDGGKPPALVSDVWILIYDYALYLPSVWFFIGLYDLICIFHTGKP